MLKRVLAVIALTVAVVSAVARADDDSWYKNDPLVEGSRWQDSIGQTHEARNGQDVVILSRLGNPCVSNVRATDGALVCITAQDSAALQQLNAQPASGQTQARDDLNRALVETGAQLLRQRTVPAPTPAQQPMYCRMQGNGVMRCDAN